MIQQYLAGTSEMGTTGNRVVDAGVVADSGVTSEAQSALILALRYKERGASQGTEE